jgi:predicted GIY-YIG superfamily endonuclease
MTTICTLYRFFNEQNELLYVGISMNLWNRFQDHRKRKSWWREVTSIRVVHYDDIDDAARAEKIAIAQECPIYNIVRPRVKESLVATSPDQSHAPAAGVEALLGRQAHWCRTRTLLDAGISPEEVIAEAQDPEMLHSMIEELPIYLRSKGAQQEEAQAVVPALYERLVEITSRKIVIGQ